MTTRQTLQEALSALEQLLQEEGRLVLSSIDRVSQALLSGDDKLADEVIAADDAIDRCYIAVDRGVEELIALQAPVAGDLRLVLAILHCNQHLERIGDQCVNIAKLTKLTLGLVIASELLDSFNEMSERAELMVAEALAAFANRDAVRAEALVALDALINEENRHLARRIMEIGGDQRMREAGLRAILISRCLERIGDNAVDIGEQTSYLVSGEFREFTDASH